MAAALHGASVPLTRLRNMLKIYSVGDIRILNVNDTGIRGKAYLRIGPGKNKLVNFYLSHIARSPGFYIGPVLMACPDVVGSDKWKLFIPSVGQSIAGIYDPGTNTLGSWITNVGAFETFLQVLCYGRPIREVTARSELAQFYNPKAQDDFWLLYRLVVHNDTKLIKDCLDGTLSPPLKTFRSFDDFMNAYIITVYPEFGDEWRSLRGIVPTSTSSQPSFAAMPIAIDSAPIPFADTSPAYNPTSPAYRPDITEAYNPTSPAYCPGAYDPANRTPARSVAYSPSRSVAPPSPARSIEPYSPTGHVTE